MKTKPRTIDGRVPLRAWAEEHADEYAFFSVLVALVYAGHLDAQPGPDGRWWAEPAAIRTAYNARGDEVRYIPRELLTRQRQIATDPPTGAPPTGPT